MHGFPVAWRTGLQPLTALRALRPDRQRRAATHPRLIASRAAVDGSGTIGGAALCSPPTKPAAAGLELDTGGSTDIEFRAEAVRLSDRDSSDRTLESVTDAIPSAGPRVAAIPVSEVLPGAWFFNGVESTSAVVPPADPAVIEAARVEGTPFVTLDFNPSVG